MSGVYHLWCIVDIYNVSRTLKKAKNVSRTIFCDWGRRFRLASVCGDPYMRDVLVPHGRMCMCMCVCVCVCV